MHERGRIFELGDTGEQAGAASYGAAAPNRRSGSPREMIGM